MWGNASSVMLMRCSAGMWRPVSSAISLAAAPAKVPASSSMPAGSSSIESEPAGIRACTVRMTCFSVSVWAGTSSGWRISFMTVVFFQLGEFHCGGLYGKLNLPSSPHCLHEGRRIPAAFRHCRWRHWFSA